MKTITLARYLKSALFLVALVFLGNWSSAQVAQVTDPSVDDPNYDSEKQALTSQIKLPNGNTTTTVSEISIYEKPINSTSTDNGILNKPGTSSVLDKATSSCFIPLDASYTAIPRNDDGSFGPIALPFTFDLYGSSYTQVWINTNGNLTFTGAYSSFTSTGFPFNLPMVAPFWADVDTRNTAGGQIHYKLSATNLIVTWDNVGYYSQAVDKLNEFQVIISDGLDPITGIGQNTCFNYGDMQWTTGTASQGTNGFGGIPATVGSNKGNGIDFYQLGRFGVNSSIYDGPGGNTDGISYLDQQCYCAQTSSVQNIAPIANNFPSGVINVPCGDTFNLNFSFIPPEVNQTVSTTVNVNGTCGTTFTSTTGSLSNISFSLIGQQCNEGTNVITFTGTDNGIPIESTTVTLTIIVGSCCDLTASSTGQNESCANQSDGSISVSTAGGTAPLQYSIDGGVTYSSNPNFSGLATGSYIVSALDANGCESAPQTITISGPAQLVATALSNGIPCYGGTADVTVSATGGNAPYSGTGVFNLGNGTYNYTVTDANGCTASTSITLTAPSLMTAYTSCPLIDCFGGTADMAVFAFGGMAPYTGTGVFNVGAGVYNYIITDANGCISTVSHTVTQPAGTIVVSLTSTGIDCNGGTADVTVSGTGGAAPYTGTGVFTVPAGNYTYSIADANGCTGNSTITISEPGPIEANISPQSAVIDCIPIPVTLSANPTGGTSPYTYAWSTNETTPAIDVNPSSTTTYSVVVTDANGCTSTLLTNQTTVTTLNRCGANFDYLICHSPLGNPAGEQTICVSPSALNTHLSTLWTLHENDYCGQCQSVPDGLITTDNINEGNNMFIRAGINSNNETISLSYRIAYDSKVRLEIYDMAGVLVDVVHTSQANEGDLYEYSLTTDKISSGVYLYQFITDREIHIDKLQIIQE